MASFYASVLRKNEGLSDAPNAEGPSDAADDIELARVSQQLQVVLLQAAVSQATTIDGTIASPVDGTEPRSRWLLVINLEIDGLSRGW